MKLFMPEKYLVTQGNPNATVGFCTVWNKPEILLQSAPELGQKACIIGTLYSRQGVNPLLRNLALNPHIRTLVLWGSGPLSQTPFGKSGSGIIQNLWEKGVDDNGSVIGTTFAIEPEITPSVVRIILKNVQLLDLSEFELSDAVLKLPVSESPNPYMQSVEFDPPTPRVQETLPSESIGVTIHGTTVMDTWVQVIFEIMRYGKVKGTQYGLEQREFPGMQWVIHNQLSLFPEDIPEDWPEELREIIGATQSSIEQYRTVFMESKTKEGVAYTYGSRLRAWKHDGSNEPIDQVADCIIRNLKTSPDSRRGIAITFVPPIDTFAKMDTPCLVSVQALQEGGAVNLFATFRSHDLFKAAIPNAFGLIALHEEIARETGFERGVLCIHSISAHIYEGDFEHAKKMIDCRFIERSPVEKWDGHGADPCGSFLIRIDKNEIVAEHQGPDGSVLGEYRGKSAKSLSLKISQLRLISMIGHALDIGHELQKAEHALKLGISYTQDTPLQFD